MKNLEKAKAAMIEELVACVFIFWDLNEHGSDMNPGSMILIGSVELSPSSYINQTIALLAFREML